MNLANDHSYKIGLDGENIRRVHATVAVKVFKIILSSFGYFVISKATYFEYDWGGGVSILYTHKIFVSQLHVHDYKEGNSLIILGSFWNSFWNSLHAVPLICNIQGYF